jgi:Xaa-Pro aminopeptidase
MEALRYVNDTTAVLIITPENRRYLTGFHSSLGYLLMTAQGNTLFVDSRYFEAASKKAVGAEVVLFKQFLPELQAELDRRGVKKLLIETENSVSLYNALKSKLTVRVTPSQPLSDRLISLRSVKKREEVESIIMNPCSRNSPSTGADIRGQR